jgi:FMN reductase [NAD(P)H]
MPARVVSEWTPWPRNAPTRIKMTTRTTINARIRSSRDHAILPRLIENAATSQYSQKAPQATAKMSSTALTGVDNAGMSETQPLYELLKKRRAVRSYTGERVPRETLERITRAARRGPNAGYSQGLRLLVVDDPAVIEELASAQDDERARGWFAKAAAHVFVLTREQDYHDRYNQPDKLAATGGVEVIWPVPFWHVDAGAALMLLWLAALEEGLAAAVYGVPVEDDARMRELLGIPDDLTIVVGVTVGHPAEDPDWERATSVFSQRRRAQDEVVQWNRWSS